MYTQQYCLAEQEHTLFENNVWYFGMMFIYQIVCVDEYLLSICRIFSTVVFIINVANIVCLHLIIHAINIWYDGKHYVHSSFYSDVCNKWTR